MEAVNGISFQIEKGKTLGLVGETGAGKTTTALSILRLLPETTGRIKSGVIRFEGKDLLSASEEQLRGVRGNRISMVFQDPMSSLNPVYTVGDQIGEAIRLHNAGISPRRWSGGSMRFWRWWALCPPARWSTPTSFPAA